MHFGNALQGGNANGVAYCGASEKVHSWLQALQTRPMPRKLATVEMSNVGDDRTASTVPASCTTIIIRTM